MISQKMTVPPLNFSVTPSSPSAPFGRRGPAHLPRQPPKLSRPGTSHPCRVRQEPCSGSAVLKKRPVPSRTRGWWVMPRWGSQRQAEGTFQRGVPTSLPAWMEVPCTSHGDTPFWVASAAKDKDTAVGKFFFRVENPKAVQMWVK